jgi:hypothetical protein
MTYRMFLDDVRDPAWVYPEQQTQDWIVCRSVSEAQSMISDLGCPCWISFDHDLGDQVSSGHDLAQWLVEQDLEEGQMPQDFSYACHSANPVGAANICGLLDNYLRHKRDA